jgi:hypothetical protein
MPFRETVVVCENNTEDTNTLCAQNAVYTYKFSSYLTGNILCLRYEVQPVNAV